MLVSAENHTTDHALTRSLTAADIPDADGDAVVTSPYWRPAPRFQHVPTVHLLRDGENVLVTGPVEPRLPVGNEATQPGWDRWSDDVAGARIVAVVASKAKNDARRRYFDDRQADKEARFQEKCDRALAAGKPLPKRSESRPPPVGWALYVKNEDLIKNTASARNALQVSRRMKRYRFDGGLIAGRETAAFIERFENEDGDSVAAIRSWLNIASLALFSSALPKAGIIFGRDKTKVDSSSIVGLDALFARDMPYIETDRSRRCLFVVDLDGWFRSIEALRRALRKLLPPEFMPNLIVYRASETQGGVENPHLIWLLPPGSRVLRGEDRDKQFTLHAMIQRAIVSHLIPLGADPDHHNTWKMKNPLSPAWSVACCDDNFATMHEWREFLPTITPDAREMKRRSKVHRASEQCNGDLGLSNAIWNDAISARRIEIKSAQHRKDPGFLTAIRTQRGFVGWLYDRDDGVVTLRLIREHGDTPAVRSVLRAQREYVVELHALPSDAGCWKNRGRDAYHLQMNVIPCLPPLSRNATAEERADRRKALQGEGGRRSRQITEQIHRGLIAEEIENRLAAGLPIIKAEVVNALIKAGTVGRSTAYAHFDTVLEIVLQSARYQVSLSDTQPEQPNSPSNQASNSHASEHSDHRIPVVNLDSARHLVETTAVIRSKPLNLHLRSDYDAYRLRQSGRMAVAAWRQARNPESGGDDTRSVRPPTTEPPDHRYPGIQSTTALSRRSPGRTLPASSAPYGVPGESGFR